MRTRRTFHISAKDNETIDVRECGDSVSITVKTAKIFLTREQFDALCSIRFDLCWEQPGETEPSEE